MKSVKFNVVAIAWTILVSTAGGPAAADEPDGLRVFAAIPVNVAEPADCPDWLGPDSRRLVVTGKAYASPWIFASPGPNDVEENWQILGQDSEGNEIVLFDLRDTIWLMAPTMHVTTRGPAPDMTYVWLQPNDPLAEEFPDVPLAGTTTATGPDGDILVQKTFLVRQIDDNASLDDGKWEVVTSGASHLFCVGVGLFNK